MDPNRFNAATILFRIISQGKKIKGAMADSLAPGTPGIDRAFIMEIVYGCVRYKLYLDWLLGHLIKDVTRLGDMTRANLLAGIYQIEFMRVPEWAAVHETVEVEKAFRGNASLVNAVLRNYLRKQHRFRIPSFSRNPVKHISLATSHPEWLIRKWSERFPAEEVLRLAQANNAIPPLSIRVNTLVSSIDEIVSILHQRNIPSKRSTFSPDGLVLNQTPFSAVADLRGKIFIQDEASQIMGHLLDPRPGDTILDACAAPGGKTTHLAQITRNAARILAVEKDTERMSLLSENIRMHHAESVQLRLMSILDFRSDDEFDRILLDAPCSALGVIRRNPDVKYRHSPEALRDFGRKQLEILTHVSAFLEKKGTLLYSVCSTEPEETLDVIESFLNNRRDFYIIDTVDDSTLPVPFQHSLKGLMSREGYFVTYPHIHNTDGFFAVRLGRK